MFALYAALWKTRAKLSMRVIAGAARGMRLKRVPGAGARPIMDRVKEALFNIIGGDIRGVNFLDLFAGTGSVGIEALSRGAGFAQFNELDPQALATIRHNLAHTKLAEKARVTRSDAFQLIARQPMRRYRYIFVAPPQYRGMWLKTLEAFDANAQWRHQDCQIIIQIDPDEFDASRRFDHIEALDQRRYGRTMLIFYRFVDDASVLQT